MRINYTIKGRKEKLTISDVKFIDQTGKPRELTYWLHDYGKLPYWMKKYGNIDGDQLWESLLTIFAFEELFQGAPAKAREKWYLWHISKLMEIDVTRKSTRNDYTLGKIGKLAFEAAKRSSGFISWSEAMESLIISYLIARRIENFGDLLALLSQKPIEVFCANAPKALNKPQSFHISWKDLSTSLENAYFILAESPSSSAELVTSNEAIVLSTFLLNEIYTTMANLRRKIVEKVANVGKTANPYLISDRGSYEIKRALERLGILKSKISWFTTLPDRILLSSVLYALAKTEKDSISTKEFTDVIRIDFRFLVDPNDVIDFLTKSVKYHSLGVDLFVLRNNLEKNYERLVERLVNLGLASIRPDGEAVVGII